MWVHAAVGATAAGCAGTRLSVYPPAERHPHPHAYPHSTHAVLLPAWSPMAASLWWVSAIGYRGAAPYHYRGGPRYYKSWRPCARGPAQLLQGQCGTRLRAERPAADVRIQGALLIEAAVARTGGGGVRSRRDGKRSSS